MCVCMCVCSSLQHVEGFTENPSKNTYFSIRVIPCNINVLFHQLGVQKGHSSFSDKVNITALPTLPLKVHPLSALGSASQRIHSPEGLTYISACLSLFLQHLEPRCVPFWRMCCYNLRPIVLEKIPVKLGTLCLVTSSPKGLIFIVKAQLLCSWGIIQSAISGSRTLQKDNRGLEPLPHSATFKSGGFLMYADIHAYGSLIVPLLPEVSMCWEVEVA